MAAKLLSPTQDTPARATPCSAATLEGPDMKRQDRPAHSAPAEKRLAEVLRHVAEDSRVEPQRYLDETIAPCGGE